MSAMSLVATGELQGVITLGNVDIDQDTYRVRVAKEYVAVSVREFDLLTALVEQRGRIVASDELEQAVWGATGRPYSRRLAVLIYRLRTKLHASQPYRVVSVRGRGYGLLPDGAAS
jgi:two-component system alkaline phosphatase synthesis response regulator PhoP